GGRLTHGLVSARRFTHNLGIGHRVQQPMHAIPKEGMIVGNQDTDLVHAVFAPGPVLRDSRSSVSTGRGSGIGRRTCTQVPPANPGLTPQVPPNSSARSRIEVRPTPRLGANPNPQPLSSISNSSRRSSAHSPRRTTQLLAWEWRTTLVSASWAMRNVAPSTAAGRGGKCSGA